MCQPPLELSERSIFTRDLLLQPQTAFNRSHVAIGVRVDLVKDHLLLSERLL